jgi:hypothetical protein
MLFGERTPSVFSRLVSENQFGDAENFATVSLHGKDAPLVEVVISSFMAYPQGEMFNLSCSRGGLTGNATQLKWKYYDPTGAPRREALPTIWSDQRKYNSEQLPWVEESWSFAIGDDLFKAMSKALYDNVYDVLTKGAEPIVKLEQVRRQVAVLEECHRQNPLPARM